MKLYLEKHVVVNQDKDIKKIFPYTLIMFSLISLSSVPLHAAEDANNVGDMGVSTTRSTDGSAKKLSWDYCRNEADEQEMVICLEKGIYDPCSDASSGDRSYWTAQCAWAHNSLSEKNILKYEDQIKERLSKNNKGAHIYATFTKAEEEWKTFRKSYCAFSSNFSEYARFDVADASQYAMGYCLRRLAEQHEKELMDILKQNSQ